MHRNDLIQKLSEYVPGDVRDAQACAQILEFVRKNPRCFDRSLSIGHVTGSAWLLDARKECVLLTLHARFGKWLQLGGHADGNPNVVEVALREAREESGIDEIAVLSSKIFDLDVHEIPARPDTPAHFHYDVRFLMQAAGDRRFHVSNESADLAWVPFAGIAQLETDESVRRMCAKWLALAALAAPSGS